MEKFADNFQPQTTKKMHECPRGQSQREKKSWIDKICTAFFLVFREWLNKEKRLIKQEWVNSLKREIEWISRTSKKGMIMQRAACIANLDFLDVVKKLRLFLFHLTRYFEG